LSHDNPFSAAAATALAPSIARRGWFKAITGLLALAAALVALYFAGPRNEFGPASATPRAQAPQDLAALDAWLAAQEAQVPDIRPGNAKGIVWAQAPGQRTPWAVVYLHGFSASRLETAPLTEQVAQALGANVYYARLTGHGQNGAAMGEARVQDWLADAHEALSIGRQLGEKVLVISCSTGATLATWLETNGPATGVAGHVFVSPNFGPKDERADLINGPWGHRIAYAILGDERRWTPDSEAEKQAWTSSYPTRSLFPMMALVKATRESALERFTVPVMVLYSPKDQTVEPRLTKDAVSRFSSTNKQLVQVDYSESKGQHVLAGAIKAPTATAPMAQSIVNWTRTLGP
jgi:esterase/lipase